MKKIVSAIAVFAMALGVAVTTTAPAYATLKTEDCPTGSLQGYTGSGNKYVVEGTEAERRAAVTQLKNITVGTDGKVSNVTFSSVAQCNMNGNDLKGSDLMGTLQTIITVVLGVLGIVAVVIIILGGVQYVTSSGDPGKVKKAKDTIMYGIIGLLIALLAYAIVNFVLSSVFGS